MGDNSLDTKQIILEAAEAEFLEKGYGNAKTLSIAKRAGISHSMLHYYFNTKENLFQMIFLKKIQTLFQLFEGIFVQHLSFTETIRFLVETQFNFVAQNPKLPYFILSEVLSNKDNCKLLINTVYPKITNTYSRFEKILTDEMEKGTIRSVKPSDLIINALSINISTFLAMPVLEEIFSIRDGKMMEKMLNERRENNVQFILNALKP
jgi:AcrR family transcriptional regulator